jgi:hypothetical protein
VAEQHQMLSSTSKSRPVGIFSRSAGIALAILLVLSLASASKAEASAPAHAGHAKASKGSKAKHRHAASVSRQRGKGKKSEPAPAPEATETPTATEPVPAPEPTEGTTATSPEPEPAPAPAPETEPPPTPEPAPETAPAPEPAAAPVSAPSLLFNGSKISDFWINHSASGAISETSDPGGGSERAIKMTVKDGDVYPITPTENPRAELLSPALIEPGMEFWLSTKFFVPSDYPTIPSSGWVSLVSVYGAPFNGPSPWRLELAGGNLQWQRNATYNWDVPFQVPLPRGKWVEVVTHERFGSAGFVEMWINGKAVTFFGSGTYNPRHVAPTEHLQMATMDASNNGDANSAKIMQYRKAGMFSTGTIYFGPLRIGSTRIAMES